MYDLITPISYWVLTLLWLVILGLYLSKLRRSRIVGGAVAVLLTILAVDAFRTLFESIYFGLYFNSLYGLLPKGIHEVLLQPSFVFIPKLINVIAGFLVLFLLIRRWVPRELREREEWIKNLQRSNHMLQESEARFRNIIENLPDTFYRTDASREITMVSPSCMDIFGYSSDEMVGRNLADFCVNPHVYVEAEQSTIEAAGNPVPLETMVNHRNGTQVTISTKAFAKFDDTGNFAGIEGIARDITESKRAEILLLEAKEDAENASRAKSEFLASMSHELRTPMNAVLGFAQMLQYDSRHPLTPTQNEHVESILEGGHHLLELINEILDLASIEADRVSLSLEETNANQIVEDCVALMVPAGETRDISIINLFSNRPVELFQTDHLRFKQVLLNLLSNAIKYNKDGGTVTVEGRETGDGYFRISVADTGIGIARQDFSGIFQMFCRIGANPELTRAGTGIGLTVSKQLVELMAGQIGFESEENIGSTFWVEMPLASNKDVLIWSDALSLGVDAIDKDHQTIVKMINKVSHHPAENKEMDEIIGELVTYTCYHFRREEMIMEICAHPGLEEHRSQHRILADKMNSFADNWRKTHDPETLQKLQGLLRGWWYDHIMKVDREITQYTKGNEQKIRILLSPLE